MLPPYVVFIQVSHLCVLDDGEYSTSVSPLSCHFLLPGGESIVAEGEDYTMQCTASYTGDPGWTPTVEWEDPEGIIHEIIDNSEAGFMNISAVAKASLEQDGYVHVATILFKEYVGTVPPTAASNIPDFKAVIEFDPLIIHCEFLSRPLDISAQT